MRKCSVGDTGLYDAVGWQSTGWSFPFVGAEVVAAQTTRMIDKPVLENQPADIWTATGDSVRMPDGQLVPRTLGALKARYGRTLDFPEEAGDDMPGARAYACRFPYLQFHLIGGDSAGRLTASARIESVEMPIKLDTIITRQCAGR